MYVELPRGSASTKLNAQLPDALSLIANSLKAGFGLMQSLDLASRELDHPIATEHAADAPRHQRRFQHGGGAA